MFDKNTFNVNLISGLSGGFVSSAILHIPDRLIFLAQINKTKVINKNSLVSPLHGLIPNVIQKTYSNGIYFFLQKELQESLPYILPKDISYNQQIINFNIGLCAGTITGMINHPFSAIRSFMWTQVNGKYTETVIYMWKHGGVNAFLRGMKISVAYSAVYGITYEVLRKALMSIEQLHTFEPQKGYGQLLSNILASTIALAVSTPLNYLRNRQFANNISEKNIHIIDELKILWLESGRNYTNRSYSNRFLFFSELCKSMPTIYKGVASTIIAQETSDSVAKFISK